MMNGSAFQSFGGAEEAPFGTHRATATPITTRTAPSNRPNGPTDTKPSPARGSTVGITAAVTAVAVAAVLVAVADAVPLGPKVGDGATLRGRRRECCGRGSGRRHARGQYVGERVAGQVLIARAQRRVDRTRGGLVGNPSALLHFLNGVGSQIETEEVEGARGVGHLGSNDLVPLEQLNRPTGRPPAGPVDLLAADAPDASAGGGTDATTVAVATAVRVAGGSVAVAVVAVAAVAVAGIRVAVDVAVVASRSRPRRMRPGRRCWCPSSRRRSAPGPGPTRSRRCSA